MQKALRGWEGLWHVAGTLADSTLPMLTAPMLVGVYGSKAYAAWTQQRGCAALSLLSCIFFSGSLFGNAGQANYAAANFCLDGLAVARKAWGVPGVSVQWGPWAELGMHARAGGHVSARLAEMGIGEIGLVCGLVVLRLVVTAPIAGSVAALRVSWGRFVGDGEAQPLFAALTPKRTSAKVASGRAVQLAQPAVSLTMDEVLTMSARAAGQSVNADAPLMDAGLDSLGAVELRNQLQSAIGNAAALPHTIVFEHPTVRSLARFATEEIGPALVVQAAQAHSGSDIVKTGVVLDGISAKLPGGVSTSAAAWRMNAGGLDTIGEVPAARWEIPPAEGRIAQCIRHAGFTTGAELFDNLAFGLSSKESLATDPQQRLLLEHGYAVCAPVATCH